MVLSTVSEEFVKAASNGYIHPSRMKKVRMSNEDICIIFVESSEQLSSMFFLRWLFGAWDTQRL